MKSKFLSQVPVAAALLALAACSSAPVQFYTLVKPAVTTTPAASGLAITVLPVSVPAQVDVPQLVVRQSTSELALAEEHQWLAPLGQEIRSALSAELAATLGAQDVSGVRTKGLEAATVRLEVRRFESTPGKDVLLESLWSLRMPGQEKTAVCTTRIQEKVGSSYASVVEGHQRALSQLAAQIAGSIKAAQASSSSPRCPA